MIVGDGRNWNVTGVHHIAFAHGDDPTCEDALAALLRCEPSVETAPGFVERMYPVGDAYVQTLEPTGEGVVASFVDKRGPALHHVAFSVDAIDAAVADLRAAGTRLIDERPRAGGLATRIAFIHPSVFGGLLVELVETDPSTVEA